MKKSSVWWFVVVVLLGLFFYYRYRVTPHIEIPKVTIIDENGNHVLLSSKHQGPLVVNFFATWCGSCMQEMPSLQEASLMNNEVTVIGLTDDDPKKIARMRKHYGITFPMYRLDKSLKDYGIYTIPTTIVYGPDNELLLDYIGVRNWADPELLDKVAKGIPFD